MTFFESKKKHLPKQDESEAPAVPVDEGMVVEGAPLEAAMPWSATVGATAQVEGESAPVPVHSAEVDFACDCGKRWTRAAATPAAVEHHSNCPGCGRRTRLKGVRIREALKA